MSAKVSTHLMFDGVAEKVVNFYLSVLEGAEPHSGRGERLDPERS